MEISISDIISIVGLLLGGGGIGMFFTWRYTRRKEEAEATSAEASAAKELQDVYQQLINDIKVDRDEQKAYISELKDDRHHLREENSDLRERIDKTDETVRELQMKVANNDRMIREMRPFLCSVAGCPNRKTIILKEENDNNTKQNHPD
jgi:hypothetical protein